MFKDAQNVNTSDLLEKIVTIIGNDKNTANPQDKNTKTVDRIGEMFMNTNTTNRNLGLEDVQDFMDRRSTSTTPNSNYTTNEDVKPAKPKYVYGFIEKKNFNFCFSFLLF